MNIRAKKMLAKLNKKLRTCTLQVRRGDAGAGLKVIQTMTERNIEMAKLGYRHNGKDMPDGRWLTLRQYDKLYAERDKMRATKTLELTEKARTGDMEAVRELIKIMSND